MTGTDVVSAISRASPQRARSAVTMIRRRGWRSTSAPATAPNSSTGTASNTTARLTASPEPVREKIRATSAT